jgi:hypothetical protein
MVKRDPASEIIRLELSGSARTLQLLRGDDGVLFFLNHKQQPMVGSANYSYTLNRRNQARP